MSSTVNTKKAQSLGRTDNIPKPKQCSYVYHKQGEADVQCVNKPVGKTKATQRQLDLHIPCDNNNFTGSDEFCYRHQILERWWPYCDWCNALKVSPEAKGKTAYYCYVCINSKAYEVKPVETLELSDPELSKSSVENKHNIEPLSVWATIVKADEPLQQIVETQEIKLMKQQAEEMRLKALQAETAYKQALASEEIRIANEAANAKAHKEQSLRNELADYFKKGFNLTQTEKLLKLIKSF